MEKSAALYLKLDWSVLIGVWYWIASLRSQRQGKVQGRKGEN
jgi:hypothetical protein